MLPKFKNVRYIYLLYWVLLAYIIAALVWWFVALTRQNDKMAEYKIQELQQSNKEYASQLVAIKAAQKRKTTQYIGEGVTFFLLIAAGAAVVFSLVQRQLKQSVQQQNFMIALTHELKTPIAVAKLNLETLQKRKLEESQQQRLIQTTLQEANRLNALCNNMLLSSQMEARGFSLSKEEINFSEAVTGCAQDFIRRYPDKKIFVTAAPEIFVYGDALLLQMAINNLIDNAIKYAPKDTTVQITADVAEDKARVSVADNGKGITDEEKEKVFDKFYRTGNAATKGAKGTGLGLFLIKKIAQEHNGNIFVTDNAPSGCIFTLSLPVLQ
jgi:two-component system, OmpR family, sensor histidine kinase CiaH